jgi:hypothetical protein
LKIIGKTHFHGSPHKHKKVKKDADREKKNPYDNTFEEIVFVSFFEIKKGERKGGKG